MATTRSCGASPMRMRTREDVGILNVDNARETRGGFSLYVPEYYDAPQRWPLIVALHGGSGHGADFLWSWLREARTRGCIVISPTSRGGTWSLMESDARRRRAARTGRARRGALVHRHRSRAADGHVRRRHVLAADRFDRTRAVHASRADLRQLSSDAARGCRATSAGCRSISCTARSTGCSRSRWRAPRTPRWRQPAPPSRSVKSRICRTRIRATKIREFSIGFWGKSWADRQSGSDPLLCYIVNRRYTIQRSP